MNVKVSVIIPVYNAETYLPACVESLLAQTLQECEFLFVNDGSIDSSAAILKGYQSRDDRIILINQMNAGVSTARNEGIRRARGEYIGFVDADDWVEPDMYERMYQAASRNECDVVISNFESQMNGKTVLTRYDFPSDTSLNKSYIQKNILPIFMRTAALNAVWNKIFRKDLIEQHVVAFKHGMALGEDKDFNMNIFSYANTIVYLDYRGYHYREVEGSATHNIAKMDYFGNAIEVFRKDYPIVYASQFDPSEIKVLKSIELMKAIISYIHIYFNATKELGFWRRYSAVNRALEQKEVREAFHIYVEHRKDASRYEKCMTFFIKIKSTLGLYCLTAYSRYRNEMSNGG
ncbi:glycosyltransferase [Paenibacillus sp. GSMTC-2017]|uniref:glycosyltransferase family 2 protein n=1 Tax=Paenibacillus sp. GSMTC-2017 TaxID=2794350 RepID=UPI0018D9FA93|nr:glycosyltransferase [Paenibacillus sp. GSMTC-2017]MBH5317298.1 glycosyltransferase [Paenibacillus sp. GSMTC-2017]